MSETHVLTFLTSVERTLVIALLEERLTTLVETLGQAEHSEGTSPIRDQMKIAVALLNKLHRASVLDQSVTTPPEHQSSA